MNTKLQKVSGDSSIVKNAMFRQVMAEGLMYMRDNWLKGSKENPGYFSEHDEGRQNIITGWYYAMIDFSIIGDMGSEVIDTATQRLRKYSSYLSRKARKTKRGQGAAYSV